MSELERIIGKYLSKDETAITYSDFNQEEVNKLFQNMGIYERPDILSMYDNKIVAIEHFEFDSYKNTRKGSNFKIQDNTIEKRMQNKIDKDLKTEKEIWLHDEIKNTSSLEQYYNNFKKVLLTHIENIPEYKTPLWKKEYPKRKETIERVFGDCKEHHGLRYTKLRGLKKNEQQASLIFSCHNLKKMALWRWKILSFSIKVCFFLHKKMIFENLFLEIKKAADDYIFVNSLKVISYTDLINFKYAC